MIHRPATLGAAGLGLLLGALPAAAPAQEAWGDFGEDDEVEVDDPTEYPASAACRLAFRFGNSGWYSCSGTLIGSHHVLTAGHCVHQQELGGTVSEMTVSPAYDEGDQPFGEAHATRFRILDGWEGEESFLFDLGLVTLDRPLGVHAGHLGLEALATPEDYVGLVLESNHYPADPIGDGHDMFHSEDVVVHADEHVLGHELDTSNGSSGAGLFRQDDEGAWLLAVNSAHFGGFNNTAPRLDDERLAWIDEALTGDPRPADLPDLLGLRCYAKTTVVEAGTDAPLSLLAANWGTAAADAYAIDLYLDDDGGITHNDEWLGRGEGQAIPALSNEIEDLAIPIPADASVGTWSYGVILDPDDAQAEVDETNGALACEGELIVIPPQAGDDDDTFADPEGCTCGTAAGMPVAPASCLVVLFALLLRRRRPAPRC